MKLLLGLLALSSIFVTATDLEEIQKGVEYYFNEDFTQAEEVFLHLIQSDTARPAGYYFLALTYQAQMWDQENDFKKEEFEAAMAEAVRLSESAVKATPRDKFAHLFLGNAYGSWALQQARQRKWLSAWRTGLRAKDNWEKAIRLDSAFYDAYTGLGSYLYWKSNSTKKIAWLPFIKDQRKQGIGLLTLAAESSLFSREFARSSLMWIGLREKNYSKALELAHYFQERYPKAKFPQWAESFIYYEKFDWRNALASFGRLLTRLEEDQPYNYYNLIEVEFRLANCHYNLGENSTAQKLCHRILSYPLDKKTKERQKDKLKKIWEMKRKIEKETKASH